MPRDPSDTCQRCNGPHDLEAMVSPDLWAAISGDYRILCLRCMDDLASARGLSGYVVLHFSGRALYFDGTGSETVQMALARHEIERLSRVVNDLRAALRNHQQVYIDAGTEHYGW